MSSANPANGRQFRGRMARMILAICVPASLLPLAAVGSLALLYGGRSLRELPGQVLISWAGLVGLALLLTWLIIWLTARRLTRPLSDLADSMHRFIAGNWEERAPQARQDETGWIASLFNQLADERADNERLAARRQSEPETMRRQAIAQLCQIATYSISLDELLDHAIKLTLRNLGCMYTAVYLIEQSGEQEYAVLYQATGAADFEDKQLAQKFREKKILINPISTAEWLVGKAIDSKHPQIGSRKGAPEIFEAAIPITLGSQVLGAFDLYAASSNLESRLGPFTARNMSEFQTLANIIALAAGKAGQAGQISIKMEAGERSQNEALASLEPIGVEFEAADRHVRAAVPAEHVSLAQQALAKAVEALKQSPYTSILWVAEGEGMRIAHRWPEKNAASDGLVLDRLALREEALKPFFISPHAKGKSGQELQPILANDLQNSPLPQQLLELPRQMGCKAAAFLPGLRGEELAALLILGTTAPASDDARQSGEQPELPMTLEALSPYMDMIEEVATGLDKPPAHGTPQRSLAELQMLWNISQTITHQTELPSLYPIIHQQVAAVLGELSSFVIALYEADKKLVYIPYFYEEGQQLELAPFPLGEGLTSIVIRTGQPLALVDDVEKQLHELGAKIIGAPPKSWLGVPMLLGEEVLGVIIVQDLHQDHRFHEEDERLLSTLATQMAVVIRNTRLLEITRRQTEQEKLINEITRKIQLSADIRSILKTTADELGKALGASRAHIEMKTGEAEPDDKTEAQPSLANTISPNGKKPMEASNGNGSKAH